MLKLDMKSTVHLTVIILLIFFASPESQRPSSPRKPARLLTAAGREATPARRRAVMKRWGDLPLRFQENVGQYPGPASKFVARGKDWTVLLNHTGIILDCASPSAQLSRPGQEHKGEPFSEIRLRLTGAHGSARMSGEDKAPVKTNYFVGNDSQKWFTGVPSYGKVRYTEAFPGIDLVFYGTQGRQVECDFEVASHADPTAIRLCVEGTGKVVMDKQGSLVLRSDAGTFNLRKPFAYQITSDGSQNQEQVSAEYRLSRSGEISFDIGPYDRTKPLVIDPVLEYSTFLGGMGSDSGEGIALDPDGCAYVAGSMWNISRPTANPDGCFDAFVAKMNASGSDLEFITYLGGGDVDAATGLRRDSAGNLYVAGRTLSTDFPTKNPAQAPLGSVGGFFKSGDAGGTWAMANDGLSTRYITCLAIDPQNTAAIYAGTAGGLFKTTDGAKTWTPANVGLTFPFITSLVLDPLRPSTIYVSTGGGVFKSMDRGATWKSMNAGLSEAKILAIALEPNTPSTLYAGTSSSGIFKSTDAGGTWAACDDGLVPGSGYVVESLAASPKGAVLAGTVAGVYASSDHGAHWSKTGLLDPAYQFVFDTDPSVVYAATFRGVAKSTDGGLNWATVLYANYYGETVAVDPANHLTVYAGTYNQGVLKSGDAGQHWAPAGTGFGSLTVNALAIDPATSSRLYAGKTFAPGYDAFVAKLDSTGSKLLYSTYLGGSGIDLASGIAVDGAGNAYVAGETDSLDFPVANALQPSMRCGSLCHDGFVAKLDPAGAIVYSTYIGGSDFDTVFGIAVDSSANVYLAGQTQSRDFPAVGALGKTLMGNDCKQMAGCFDAFVAKIDASGSQYVYSACLGGGKHDSASAVALDSNGNAYVTGATESADFPLAGPLQEIAGDNGHSAFVTKINRDGSDLLYSTYLGVESPIATRILTDSTGNAYIANASSCVTELNSNGSELLFTCDYYYAEILGMALDAKGNLFVTGQTMAPDMPVTPGAYDTTCGTDGTCNYDPDLRGRHTDAFVGKLVPVVRHYFAHLADGADCASELVLVNPSQGEAASGSIAFYDDFGKPLAISLNGLPATPTFHFTLPALGTATFVTSGKGPNVSGSVQIDAGPNVSGYVRFSIPGIGTTAVMESEEIAKWVIPAVYSKAHGLNTAVAIANPQPRDLVFLLSLLTPNGFLADSEAAQVLLILPPEGHFAFFVDQAFADLNLTEFEGMFLAEPATSGSTIVATSLRFSSADHTMVGMPLITLRPAISTRRLDFAQFAGGAGLRASLFLFNRSVFDGTADVHLNDDAGGPVQGPAATPVISAVPLKMRGLGSSSTATSAEGPTVSGSARVEGSGCVGGVLTLSTDGVDRVAVGPGVSASSIVVPVRRNALAGRSTGLALTSAGSNVTVALTLRDSGGRPVANGQAQVSIVGNGHLAGYVEELFPQAQTSAFEGTLTAVAQGGNIVCAGFEIGPGSNLMALPVLRLR